MIPPSSYNDYDAPPELEPLSWMQAWTKALFSPSNETFARIAYDPSASTWRASSWLFVATLIGMLIGTPLSLVFNPTQLEPLQKLLEENADVLGGDSSMLVGVVGLMLCLVPLSAVFSVIGSMISAAIYQLIAGMLGGRGNFTAMYTAFAAFGAPIGIVSAIASSIPVVNLCVGLPLALYGLVLSVIAVDAVNRFGIGKAILTVLLPTLLVFGCCCLVFFGLGMSLGPLMGDPKNWEQFLTPMP